TESVRTFSPHRNSGCVRIALRVRRLLQAPGEDGLHRQSKKNLVGHPTASGVRYARSARLRCAIACGRYARDCRVDSGNYLQAIQIAGAKYDVSRLSPPAAR